MPIILKFSFDFGTLETQYMVVSALGQNALHSLANMKVIRSQSVYGENTGVITRSGSDVY